MWIYYCEDLIIFDLLKRISIKYLNQEYSSSKVIMTNLWNTSISYSTCRRQRYPRRLCLSAINALLFLLILSLVIYLTVFPIRKPKISKFNYLGRFLYTFDRFGLPEKVMLILPTFITLSKVHFCFPSLLASRLLQESAWLWCSKRVLKSWDLAGKRAHSSLLSTLESFNTAYSWF